MGVLFFLVKALFPGLDSISLTHTHTIVQLNIQYHTPSGSIIALLVVIVTIIQAANRGRLLLLYLANAISGKPRL